MIQHKFFEHALLAFCFLVLFSFDSSAQSDSGRVAMQVEPSYDVTLHMLIGSNDGVKGDLPASLADVSKQLKANFNFSSYRLASTFLGRISNTGTFEYKSVGDLGGRNVDGAAPTLTFLEWTIASLRSMPTVKGRPGFQAQAFRFGARVPVQTTTFQGESGKGSTVYNYESIGLSLAKIGLAENTPTLIGTLNLPGANGTIFLIMTVRATD
ncbi:MAG: hypothetical protein ACKVQW_11750 [Pyrinomonadaceae bacterium]